MYLNVDIQKSFFAYLSCQHTNRANQLKVFPTERFHMYNVILIVSLQYKWVIHLCTLCRMNYPQWIQMILIMCVDVERNFWLVT